MTITLISIILAMFVGASIVDRVSKRRQGI
jgi:hypothetical protein